MSGPRVPLLHDARQRPAARGCQAEGPQHCRAGRLCRAVVPPQCAAAGCAVWIANAVCVHCNVRGRSLMAGLEIVADCETKAEATELGHTIAARMTELGLWAQLSTNLSFAGCFRMHRLSPRLRNSWRRRFGVRRARCHYMGWIGRPRRIRRYKVDCERCLE